jgi:hypothetical protein
MFYIICFYFSFIINIFQIIIHNIFFQLIIDLNDLNDLKSIKYLKYLKYLNYLN